MADERAATVPANSLDSDGVPPLAVHAIPPTPSTTCFGWAGRAPSTSPRTHATDDPAALDAPSPCPCFVGTAGSPELGRVAGRGRRRDQKRRYDPQRHTRVACTVLRVGWVQQALVYLAELARVAPVNIKDVAAAVRACITSGRHAGDTAGQTFDLVDPPPAISGPEMAAAMLCEYGAEIVYCDVSDADMRHILAAVADMTAFEVDVHMSMFPDIRDGYHAVPGSDLGFLLPRPAKTLAEFLHENASQFRPEQ
ncbi:hypothetical protein BC828DRAFT_408571 [Blastocladiella britannica]|nr:hypothetical protein BC828DRAFT_408571 [Blastocladiella britannica]